MSRTGLIDKLKTRFGETPADSDTAATNIGGDIYDETAGGTKLSDTDGDTYIEVEESADDDHARIYTAGTERVTVDDSGNVGIGTTNPQNQLYIKGDKGGSFISHFWNDGNNANRYGISIQAGADAGTGQTYYVYCYDGDGSVVGYIENNSGTFQLVDVSDERLKYEIEPTKIKGTDIIMKIPIKEFYKKESKEKITAGFVAQDIRKIYPQATSAYNKDGEEYYGVSESKLIAPLMKMCQEQQEIIDKQQKVIHNFEKRIKELEDKKDEN